MSMDVSFIVTTFNKPQYLAAVLRSIVNNVPDCTEIIVADDGSVCTTREVVYKFLVACEVPIRYCWLPDNGFRLSRSRNLAALKAKGRFLVILDGDCVVTPGWWARQRKFLKTNRIVFGSRLLLSVPQSIGLVEDVSDGEMRLLSKGRKFLKIPLGIFRLFPKRSWRHFRGFYFSIEKSKYLELGGFDEPYIGWGLEDSDFAVRALRRGMVLFDGRYAGSLLHLHHSTVAGLTSNKSKFDQCMADLSRVRSVRSLLNT